MTTRTLLFLSAGLALIVLALLAARNHQRTLERGLPLRIMCTDQIAAQVQAGPGAVGVLGTGSMAPYIPAAPAGRDPLTSLCAYVVLVPGATINDVKPGTLVIYLPDWAGRNVMHQAAAFADGGWIMTGLHNKGYETAERMTAAKFVGLVARTYVWNL